MQCRKSVASVLVFAASLCLATSTANAQGSSRHRYIVFPQCGPDYPHLCVSPEERRRNEERSRRNNEEADRLAAARAAREAEAERAAAIETERIRKDMAMASHRSAEADRLARLKMEADRARLKREIEECRAKYKSCVAPEGGSWLSDTGF